MADTGNRLRVRLVTPDRILLDEPADAVELPAKSGYMEVLYGHAPLLTELGVGRVTLHGAEGSDRNVFVVTWGFCEVLPDRVTILASSATRPEDLDRAAAEHQLEQGQKMWNEAGDDPHKYAEANRMIHEAEAKLANVEGGS
jgi:F-type H+-transporting ATPase subunit epsilon